MQIETGGTYVMKDGSKKQVLGVTDDIVFWRRVDGALVGGMLSTQLEAFSESVEAPVSGDQDGQGRRGLS